MAQHGPWTPLETLNVSYLDLFSLLDSKYIARLISDSMSAGVGRGCRLRGREGGQLGAREQQLPSAGAAAQCRRRGEERGEDPGRHAGGGARGR